MPAKNCSQATIEQRLDYTLEVMATKGMTPRAIYLTEEDKAELRDLATKRYRDEGSEAYVYPCSYAGNIIINDKAVERLVPVRRFNGMGKSSTIYSNRGVAVAVYKRVP